MAVYGFLLYCSTISIHVFFLHATGKRGKNIHSVYLLPEPRQLLVPEQSFGWFHLLLMDNLTSKSKFLHQECKLMSHLIGISWNFGRLFPWKQFAAGNFYLSLLYSIFVTSLCLKFLHCQLILVLHLVQRLSILLTCTHFVDDCNYLNYLTRPSACCRVAPACLQPDQLFSLSPKEG